jgi:hypothetical protein
MFNINFPTLFCVSSTNVLDVPVNVYLPLTEALATAAYNLDKEKDRDFKTLPQAILEQVTKKATRNIQEYNYLKKNMEEDEKEFNAIPGSYSELKQMQRQQVLNKNKTRETRE